MIIFFVRIFQALKLSETELEESGRLSRLSALSDGEKRYVQFILFHLYSHPWLIVSLIKSKVSYLIQNEVIAIWSHDKVNFLINKREKIMFIHDIEKIGKHIM